MLNASCAPTALGVASASWTPGPRRCRRGDRVEACHRGDPPEWGGRSAIPPGGRGCNQASDGPARLVDDGHQGRRPQRQVLQEGGALRSVTVIPPVETLSRPQLNAPEVTSTPMTAVVNSTMVSTLVEAWELSWDCAGGAGLVRRRRREASGVGGPQPSTVTRRSRRRTDVRGRWRNPSGTIGQTSPGRRRRSSRGDTKGGQVVAARLLDSTQAADFVVQNKDLARSPESHDAGLSWRCRWAKRAARGLADEQRTRRPCRPAIRDSR